MSDNRIVWVTQECNNDYSAAEKYGEVRFITRSELRPFSDSKQTGNVFRDILKFKSQYVPSVDYIVLSGNPMINAVLCMSLDGKNHNFLKWNNRSVGYTPFVLNPIK